MWYFMPDKDWESRPEFRDLRSALIASGFCRIMRFNLVKQPAPQTIETLLRQEPDLPISKNPCYTLIRITGVEDHAGQFVPRSKRVLVDLNSPLTYTQERFEKIIDAMRPPLMPATTLERPDHSC